jgi:ribosomal protein S4
MINLKILKQKRIKLNTLFTKRTPEINLLRTNYFYNYAKFRKKKWYSQRGQEGTSDSIIFRRFAPNITYIPNYSHYINVKHLTKDTPVKIDKSSQLLSYRSRVELRRRLSGFFLIRKKKNLKKFLTFRYMNLHFNVFDSNFEVFLLRLGLVSTIKEARIHIKNGILKVNKKIVNQTRHFLHLDIIEFSKNLTKFSKINYSYNFEKKGYIKEHIEFESSFFNYILYLIYQILDETTNKFEIENFENMFLGVLPFTSLFNFVNFSCIYFSTLMKNQWHFFWDFFIMKKFILYNR